MKLFETVENSESRRIRAEIRRVLMEVWDPIGVNGIPEAQDEYDCCLDGVFGLLVRGAADDEIADYLWTQATAHMGLTADKSEMCRTVAALKKIPIREGPR